MKKYLPISSITEQSFKQRQAIREQKQQELDRLQEELNELYEKKIELESENNNKTLTNEKINKNDLSYNYDEDYTLNNDLGFSRRRRLK